MSDYDGDFVAYHPPKIRYRERADVVEPDLLAIEPDPLALDAIGELARRVAAADAALRAKIAILYPPLPDGYVWVSETMAEDSLADFRSTYSIRYRARHVDDLRDDPAWHGGEGFRP